MIVAKQLTAIAAGFGLLLLAGCNDGPSNRRAEVHQMIAAATSEIQSVDAILSDPERTDEVRRRFGKVIVDLGNTQGAAPGHRAPARATATRGQPGLAAPTTSTRPPSERTSSWWMLNV